MSGGWRRRTRPDPRTRLRPVSEKTAFHPWRSRRSRFFAVPTSGPRFPVLEAWVDLGRLEDFPSHTLPGFNDRIMAWLPTMIEHRCSIGERGGFFERLRTGTWMGHVLEHVTLELQTLAGTPVGYGRARESKTRGVYKVVIEYKEEKFAIECLHAAHRLIMAAIDGTAFDVAGEMKRLRKVLLDVQLGPSTRSIVEAAAARGIPAQRLTEGSLVRLGQGARQRRILAAETERTGAVAESIAQDKELTRTLLAESGIPVPEGRPVADAADAWAVAEEIGAPVVVKPRYGNQGRGVSVNLVDPRGGGEGLARRPRAGFVGRRRAVRDGGRLPRARRRREDGGGRAAASAHRRRRRRSDGPAAGRPGQRGSAAVRRPCRRALSPLVHRRGGRWPCSREQGLTRRERARGGPPVLLRQQRQPEHRRHGRGRDRHRPSRGGGPGRRGGADHRPRRRRHRHRDGRHHAVARVAARRRDRGQRGTGTADAPRADGRHAAERRARRSSTRSSPRATTAGFPWPPSRAPTARRRSCG